MQSESADGVERGTTSLSCPKMLFSDVGVSVEFESVELTDAGREFVEGLFTVDVTLMPDAEEGHVRLARTGVLHLPDGDERRCRIFVPRRLIPTIDEHGEEWREDDRPNQSNDC